MSTSIIWSAEDMMEDKLLFFRKGFESSVRKRGVSLDT